MVVSQKGVRDRTLHASEPQNCDTSANTRVAAVVVVVAGLNFTSPGVCFSKATGTERVDRLKTHREDKGWEGRNKKRIKEGAG